MYSLAWSLAVEMQLFICTILFMGIMQIYGFKNIEAVLMILFCGTAFTWTYLCYKYKQIGLPLGIE